MAMYRITVNWTGWQGGPGYTHLFFSATGSGALGPAESAAGTVRDAFDLARGTVSSSVTWAIDPEVAVIDEATDQAVNFITLTLVPEMLQPNGAGAWAAPAGGTIEWQTDDVKNGRRVRGRTFLVPMSTSNYDQDGNLEADTLLELQAAGNEMLAGTEPFVVFSRPKYDRSDPDDPVITEPGTQHTVSRATIRDKVAVLRSRRS